MAYLPTYRRTSKILKQKFLQNVFVGRKSLRPLNFRYLIGRSNYKIIDSYPVKLRANKGKIEERRLASAFTKLTWFLQPDDWTIFDRNVGAAVLRSADTGSAQMAAYYKQIAQNWSCVSQNSAVCA